MGDVFKYSELSGILMTKREKEYSADDEITEVWRYYLTKGEVPDFLKAPWYTSKRLKSLYFHLPAEPRCRTCYYPFEGIGGSLMRRIFGIKPSKLNPHICNICDKFLEHHPGGTEIELTILFADVRGSTKMAETMSPGEFSKLINRFYQSATRVLFESGALVEKVAGDAVTAFFTEGFSRIDPAKDAIEAAHEIIKATGHHHADGPWIPVGIGIHSGIAYVGSLRSDSGAYDIGVLGDTANTGARLSGLAGVGEILVSEATAARAGINADGVEVRKLALKGRSEPIEAWVL
jgi:adenylate cyclase